MENLAPQLLASAAVVSALGGSAEDFAFLDGEKILAAQRAVTEHQRHLDIYKLWIAGQVSRLSRHDLGYAGLAKSSGFPTPEALLQSVSGISRAEAGKLIHVGTLVANTDDAAATERPSSTVPPWQAGIAAAASAGTLSLDAVEAISRGLGVPDPVATAQSDASNSAAEEPAENKGVTAEMLTAAAESLLPIAASLSVGQLHRRARELRDTLDAEGVDRRAKRQRDLEYWRSWRRDDGMVEGHYLLAGDNAELMHAIHDTATSPKRGGPRFVDPIDKARAQAVLEDPRNLSPIAADYLLVLLRIGLEADPQRVLGSRRATVRIMSTASRTGSPTTGLPRIGGRFEGTLEAVDQNTIERALCDTGTTAVTMDEDGQCIDVGRDRRLFTTRQRTGMALRDGGCRAPGCSRPPSWCEAHHINYWYRDKGRTDIADGLLLCRFHHMLFHNNGWEIERVGGRYWLRPPRSVDARQRPIEMPSKNPQLREAQNHREKKGTG